MVLFICTYFVADPVSSHGKKTADPVPSHGRKTAVCLFVFLSVFLLVKMFIFEITYFIYKILFKIQNAQNW